jgi:hypothetical protein
MLAMQLQIRLRDVGGAFAMACHAKSGLAQSMARELMPQGIERPRDHVSAPRARPERCQGLEERRPRRQVNAFCRRNRPIVSEGTLSSSSCLCARTLRSPGFTSHTRSLTHVLVRVMAMPPGTMLMP